MTKEIQLKEFLQKFQPSQEEQPVYEYLKKHPHSSLHECARFLRVKDGVALGFINSLMEKGRIRLNYQPLEIDCCCSCYYSAC